MNQELESYVAGLDGPQARFLAAALCERFRREEQADDELAALLADRRAVATECEQRVQLSKTHAPSESTSSGESVGEAIKLARLAAGDGWQPGACARCRCALEGWAERVAAAEALGIPPPVYCDTCSRDLREHDARERRAREEEAAAEFRAARVRDAWGSIPERFREHRLRSSLCRFLARPEALEDARKVLTLAKNRPVVTFVGPAQSGKTTLACAILAEIIERGAARGADAAMSRRAAGARYVYLPTFVEARKRSPLNSEAPAVVQAKAATVLVLDEMGGEPESAREMVGEIIQSRHHENRLTLITTGLKGPQVAARYPGGIVARVAWPQQATIIDCGPTARAPEAT